MCVPIMNQQELTTLPFNSYTHTYTVSGDHLHNTFPIHYPLTILIPSVGSVTALSVMSLPVLEPVVNIMIHDVD